MSETHRLWDKRFANWLMRPLAALPVSPNAITALGLIFGVSAAWQFAVGRPGWGGGLFILAALMDHADGELARMSGKTSRFGHNFDRISSAINYTAVFLGLGAGLDASGDGYWDFGLGGAGMGLLAGVSVAAIFGMRNFGESKVGESFTKQVQWGGFEHEDIMYLIAPLAWLGWHGWFVMLVCAGAPAYLAMTIFRFWKR